MADMIKLTFPDGNVREYDAGISGYDVAKSISNRLAKSAMGVVINGDVKSLPEPITENAEIRIVTFDDKEGREVFWHSSAHLMANAIKRIYPKAQLGIGPSIDDGFYYDIDLDQPISPDDFEKIEKEMVKIVDENNAIEKSHIAQDDAIQFFKDQNELLKIELIEELEEDITTYSQKDFTDLCRGPHLQSTGKIGKNFKLLTVAGAYWRGDEKNKMLQRIYGTAYPKKKLLDEHLHRLEEAKKRDHRKLGRELDLFSIQDKIGSGLILWHPKGARIRHIMEQFNIDEHYKNGYELIYTPHIAKLDLWNTSGHSGFYSDNMFSNMDVDEVDYQLKPMNCPFHIGVYQSNLRSYRELPIRLFELGTVYRYERSGVLHGLMRVRGFTQDDAHIFCTPDQLDQEILRTLNFTLHILRTFGFEDFEIYLSTQPEKFVGTQENWDYATSALQKALDESGMNYEVDPGEGVFYGPKIDIKIKDVIGRSWQCSTIQVDFNLPERFKVEYMAEDGQPHQPIMIHRALMGSVERFFGVLIEHYGGAFPLWLAPVQAKIIPISERHLEYATEVFDKLRAAGMRVEMDSRNEKMGFKIREAEVQKIPFMLIMGDKEAESKTISVRRKNEGNLGSLELDELISKMQSEINSKG